jgi:predicted dehydrogenase
MSEAQDGKGTSGNINKMNRRSFLSSAARVGAGAALLGPWVSRLGAREAGKEGLNVALIGAGAQGMVLLRDMLRIDGVRVRAVCDIWPYSRKYASGTIRKSRQDAPKLYVDYREMLAEEKDLDVAVIATPDFCHADQAVACLEGGLHVYCEKEMSNTLDGAQRIVRAARKSGKVVQIGHQRRSNPEYHHALRLIHEDNVTGRITTCYGQWNRAPQPLAAVPDRLVIDKAVLKEFGYDNMRRFRNWRWYKEYSGGPIADLGSHQVDVFNWFLRTPPSGVTARSGSIEHPEPRDWYDDALCIYEYDTPAGRVRAFYQVLNTSSFGGYYETFMGLSGTVNISEDSRKNFYVPEPTGKAPEWVNQAERVEKMGASAIKLIGETRKVTESRQEAIERKVTKPIHQLHLENFFDAIRKGGKLTCPPEVGYETCVSVLKVNEAVRTGKPLTFKPDEFRI